MSHRTVEVTERWMVALLTVGVPLAGAELVDRWRRRCDPYPPPLALAMVREHLDFASAWPRRKLLDRGELLPLYTDLTRTARNVVLVLLGLNRVYFPHLGFKWLPRVLAELPVAPVDVAGRLARLFTDPPADAVRIADALVVETLTLVVEHLPAAEAGVELAAYRTERPVWEREPGSG